VLVQLDDYVFGARVATDLVNTAPEVMISTGEGLSDPEALVGFLAEHDLHPDALTRGPPTGEDVVAVHQLREALRAVVDEPDPAAATTRAGELTVRTGTGPTLRRDDSGRWHWYIRSSPQAGLAGELALLTATSLLSVIRSLGHDRLRHCAAPTCAGAFIDTSRAGRRRYCEPAVCGNRIDAANYRARRRRIQTDS